jgi:hypothetical protein
MAVFPLFFIFIRIISFSHVFLAAGRAVGTPHTPAKGYALCTPFKCSSIQSSRNVLVSYITSID